MKNKAHNKKSPLQLAWKLSFPVFISYFSLGIVFGLLFDHLHEPWYFAPIMSFLVYAGAVQFVAIGLMAVHSSYGLILLSTLFIALRNSFYGLSFLTRFNMRGWRKAYLIFALVDANYAIMVANPPYKDKKKDNKFCFHLAALIQSYWVFGSAIGAFFASKLAHFQGLEFILVAFFSVLVFEHYLKNKTLEPVVVGAVAATLALLFVPIKMMLLAAILLSCLGLLLIYFREKRNGNA